MLSKLWKSSRPRNARRRAFDPQLLARFRKDTSGTVLWNLWDRCHDENLDGKLRDKQLDDDILCPSWEAQVIIEQCKALYNSPSRRNVRQWSRPPRSWPT